MPRSISLLTFTLFLALCSCATTGTAPPGTELSAITKQERIDYIREAEVWEPIDTAALDILEGPPGGLTLPPDGEFACHFHLPSKKPSGRSPKFFCRAGDGTIYKVKYGADNKEIYAEVSGTRILWALGFKADHMQPVRVRCHGCPEDPWEYLESIDDWNHPPPIPTPRDRLIDPAILEFYYGPLIETKPDEGVAWDEILELRSRDSEKAERQRVHREALTLLAGFLRHADSKASNQGLTCAPADIVEAENGRQTCAKPVIYIGDIGGGGGYGWRPYLASSLDDLKHLGAPSKVGYHEFASISIWSDPDACVMRIYALPNATLRKARISEEGRRFLAERLSLLSHEQLIALSKVARSELRQGRLKTADGGSHRLTHEERVIQLERAIRDEIIDHRCPPGPRRR